MNAFLHVALYYYFFYLNHDPCGFTCTQSWPNVCTAFNVRMLLSALFHLTLCTPMFRARDANRKKMERIWINEIPFCVSLTLFFYLVRPHRTTDTTTGQKCVPFGIEIWMPSWLWSWQAVTHAHWPYDLQNLLRTTLIVVTFKRCLWMT